MEFTEKQLLWATAIMVAIILIGLLFVRKSRNSKRNNNTKIIFDRNSK